MTPACSDIDTIPSARPAAIADYLTRRGWERKPFPRNEVAYYENRHLTDDDGQFLYLLVPADTRLADYARSLRDFVGAMEVIDDRPADDVWRELLEAKPGDRGGEPAA